MTLRISTPDREGVYQGSKWWKWQVLCDAQEMRELFAALAPFWIFKLTGVVDGKPIPQEVFLEEYGRWIENLKQGVCPSDKEMKQLLACAFTDDLDALWLQDVGRGYLTKIAKPLVQVQSHFFSYSSLDGVFRPMSMGPESIFWGVQFSFPQIFQDPKTMEVRKTDENAMLRKIQLWVRESTRATPFVVDGKRINAPIRIGKNCLSWIGSHPGLTQKGISVHAL